MTYTPDRTCMRLAIAGLTLCAASFLTTSTAHAQSAVDGFDPGADNTVSAIAVQSDGKIVVGGEFTMLGGGGTGTTARSELGRLNPDGSLDTTFTVGTDGGANSRVNALAVQTDDKILVGGNFTQLDSTARNRLGRLNADGSLDTFNPGVTGGQVQSLAVQADGKILVGGGFNMVAGTARSRIARLNSDGTLDASFNPGADSAVFSIAVQPDGKILIAGGFTTVAATTRNGLARLNADGSLDASFDPGTDNTPVVLAIQPDGKILVGGLFTMLGGGGTGTTARKNIGRLNADGSLDAGFDPGATTAVTDIVIQSNGQILVGGTFTALGGQTGITARSKIGRLDPDGTVDAGFDPGASGGIGVGAVAIQGDHQILVGGTFTKLGDDGTGPATATRNKIGRLHPDGSLDTTFDPGSDATAMNAVVVQPDGKILLGGTFTMVGGGGTGSTALANMARLNPDGTLDGLTTTPQAGVRALAVQKDGKILIGGLFTLVDATLRHRIARVDSSGALDGFNPGANNFVNALAVQPDGKILVGGAFTGLGGGTGTTTRNYIGRLNADGSLDTSFNPNCGATVEAIAIQPDGKILIGGQFMTVGGVARLRIARLNADGTLDAGFNPGADSNVSALVVQPDGKILVGGSFSMLGDLGGGGGGPATATRGKIARLNADGSLDTAFNPGANNTVQTMTLQSDGKIVVGGGFTSFGNSGGGLPPGHATGSGCSTPTAPSTPSTPAPMRRSRPWHSRRTARSSSGGPSRRWEVAEPARARATRSAG